MTRPHGPRHAAMLLAQRQCHRKSARAAVTTLAALRARAAEPAPACPTRAFRCGGAAHAARSSAAALPIGMRSGVAADSSAPAARPTPAVPPFHAPRPSGPPAVVPFTTTSPSWHSPAKKPPPGEGLKVTFVDSDGLETEVRAYEGDSLLDIAHANDVDLEGACEGSLACSTCHVILEPAIYEKLDEPSDEENDMLDLAFGLTETSRLGCQVVMSKDIDGIRVTLPSATRNMQVDKKK